MISLAILGAGFMGRAHAANYQTLGDRVRVKTVASRGAGRAAAVAETVGAEPSTDLEAAVSDPEVDAVDICLPTPLHREWAERALAAGKHVFLEKPLALTADDADAIVSAGTEAGRVLMIGLVLRFWPEYVELERRISAGGLGRPRAVSTYRLSPPIDWNDWMVDAAQSGGVAVDMLVHDFDQMNWLLGRPRRVFATEPRPGHVHALVEYEGAAGIAEGSVAMPRSYPFSSDIRVLCEGGGAEYAFRRRRLRARGTSAPRIQRAGCASSRTTGRRKRWRSRAPTPGARSSSTSSSASSRAGCPSAAPRSRRATRCSCHSRRTGRSVAKDSRRFERRT